MTIYSVELSPQELDQFPSPQHTIDLCSHLSDAILKHFEDKVLTDNLEAVIELRNQGTLLQGYLGLMRRSAANMMGVDYPLQIHRVHLRRRGTRWTFKVDQQFNLKELADVNPLLLLDLVNKLVRSSVKSLEPYVQSLEATQLTACLNTLYIIPDRISCIIRSHLTATGYCVDGIGAAKSLLVMVHVEFQDLIDEFRCLA